ncbi:hypothetical protein L596_017823 [Steinernema carpocapsae]|uniref:Mitochondrial inner membrane protease subunit 2 n=1 Tax=Steinernema carpocapsae TaxID=34508 RepID=A0A4U5N2S5_STECR|nr:hypothetical protein L596_017823 [Steinernema carpocapsae]
MRKLKNEGEMYREDGEVGLMLVKVNAGLDNFWRGMLEKLPTGMKWIQFRLSDQFKVKRGLPITFTRDKIEKSGEKTTLFEFSRIAGLAGDVIFNDRKKRIESVPKNCVFVVGDFPESVDSRDFGAVEIRRIEYTVVCTHLKESSMLKAEISKPQHFVADFGQIQKSFEARKTFVNWRSLVEVSKTLKYDSGDLKIDIGPGMRPTLPESGTEFRVVEANENVKRGTIVVFSLDFVDENGSKKEILGLSRVVGLAGESIYNDRAQKHERIPKNHVFLLGDNRSKAVDSRDFGPLKLENLRFAVEGTSKPEEKRAAALELEDRVNKNGLILTVPRGSKASRAQKEASGKASWKEPLGGEVKPCNSFVWCQKRSFAAVLKNSAC